MFREDERKSHELRQGQRTPTHAQSNAFDALASGTLYPSTAHFVPSRAKAFSLVPHEDRDEGKSSSSWSLTDQQADCVQSLLMEPDMEDLAAMIPRTIDFVEDLDAMLDEDVHPLRIVSQPSLGKCQSLLAVANASL